MEDPPSHGLGGVDDAVAVGLTVVEDGVGRRPFYGVDEEQRGGGGIVALDAAGRDLVGDPRFIEARQSGHPLSEFLVAFR